MELTTAVGMGVVIALILAIVICAVLLPKAKEGQFVGFAKFIRDYFLLRYLMVEAILRFFFVVNTCASITVGFFLLFSKVEIGWGESQSLAPVGLLVMILGPITFRITYELTMIAIMQLKNTMEINAKIKGDPSGVNNLFNIPNSGKFMSNVANAVHNATQPQQMYNAPQQMQNGPAPSPMNNAPQQQMQNAPTQMQNAPQQPEAPAEVTCPNCGAKVVADATFCDKCGTKLH